ncbi:hypothetical protein BBP40_007631 [Aspergillus hancockii]|nr:hypothetical protein BBP40_007631 [Aspergillus hancockii]
MSTAEDLLGLRPLQTEKDSLSQGDTAHAMSKTLKLDCKSTASRVKGPDRPKPEQADVLSCLFSTQQRPPSSNIVDVHQQIFQDKFAITGNQPLEAALNTPANSGVRPPVLDKTKADELLNKFQTKSCYFPFVTTPSNIASVDHRFLYLAVLTAASSDDIDLVRSLDARFRDVLADRVIVSGEKSLDYLQGLLVYIAWYNLHLRPMSFQVYQYLQIAVSMVADLGFNDNDQLWSSSTIEAKNACLGCYYLSSLVSTGTKRPNNAVLSDNLKAYISQLPQGICPQDNLMFRCVQLQIAIESASKGENSGARWSPDNDLASIQFQDTYSTNIARLFLSLFSEASHSAGEPRLPELPRFQFIMAKGRELLDYFSSIPMCHVPNFALAEWVRFVTVIQVLTQNLSVAADQPELALAVREESHQINLYLERLANRMGKLSRSGRNPGEFPDMFYMFKSVLGLLTPLPFAAEYDQGQHPTPHPNLQYQKGQCPVLMGMRETDFWNAYRNSPSPTPLSAYDLGIDPGMLFPSDEHLLELSPDEWINATYNLNYT